MHDSQPHLLRLADLAGNPAIGRDSHISSSPSAHVPRLHAPWALSLPKGNRPFKTHRPTCRRAVQSNPSLAHRHGGQVYLSLEKSVAAALT